MLSPRLRKFTLTLHVAASVGWLGSVSTFLALALIGLQTADAATMRTVYGASQLITWSVIVPLCGCALITGVVQSLVTPWGLFRHYWVIAKLAITVLATLLLIVHTRPIDFLAQAAAASAMPSDGFRQLRVQLVMDAALAVVALLGATVLSIYKPIGLTPYGWRRERRTRAGHPTGACDNLD